MHLNFLNLFQILKPRRQIRSAEGEFFSLCACLAIPIIVDRVKKKKKTERNIHHPEKISKDFRGEGVVIHAPVKEAEE